MSDWFLGAEINQDFKGGFFFSIRDGLVEAADDRNFAQIIKIASIQEFKRKCSIDEFEFFEIIKFCDIVRSEN